MTDRYIFHHKCGEGKFGQVYLGECRTSGQHVAIKIDDGSGLLQREAQFLHHAHRHQCPDLAPIHWYGRNGEGRLTLVLRYIGPTSMEQQTTPPTDEEWHDGIHQTAQVLKHLHRACVVHGDIKPAQWILCPSTRRWILIDFGLAEVWEPGSSTPEPTTGRRGTPLYMSIHVQHGYPIAPRDDMMSWIWTMWTWKYGPLPWHRAKTFGELERLKMEWIRSVDSVWSRRAQYIHNLAYADVPPYEGWLEPT